MTQTNAAFETAAAALETIMLKAADLADECESINIALSEALDLDGDDAADELFGRVLTAMDMLFDAANAVERAARCAATGIAVSQDAA